MQNLVTGTLVACAVLMTVTVVYREFFKEGNHQLSLERHISDWRSLTANRSQILGAANAPVQVVVFSDYQCPFCKSLEDGLRKLVQRHPEQVSVWRYELPLTKIHPHAYEAALAAKCAAQQGIHYAFQSKLFETSAKLGNLNWLDFAQETDIPKPEMLLKCVESRRLSNLVDLDLATAQKLGIDATPVLIVNGNLVSGAKDDQALEKLFFAALSDV